MKALVVGMGASGLSMARYLTACGWQVDAMDSRATPPHAAAFAGLHGVNSCRLGVPLDRLTAADFAGYARVAKSPGVPLSALAVPCEKVVGDADLFAEAWAESALPTKLLVVTGTNGKSTVVVLSAALCNAAGMRAEAVGNIGEPLLDALARWRREGAPAVAAVELSSFQLETVNTFPAAAATVLNVSPDHLDRHGNLADYAALKARIYAASDCRVVNVDEALTAAMVAAPEITFSAVKAADWRLHNGRITAAEMSFLPAAAVPAVNVLATLALLAPLHLPTATYQKTLAAFPGLPHRRQHVGCFGGVRYINDSKATNVASAVFSLQQTAGDIVLIAGGAGKGQDFAPLAAACGRVRQAIVIGRAAPLLQQSLTALGVAVQAAADMPAAVRQAAQAARHDDTVLLSPACASLDAYENYAARGAAFVTACQQLPSPEPMHAA